MSFCHCGLTEWREYGPWVAIVDACDASALDLGWHVQTRGRQRFPACLSKRIDGRTVRLHRELLKAPLGELVDHINGNPLDNRRENLRLTDATGNSRNKRVQRRSYTGFKGVHSHKLGQWRATIVADGKKHDLGVFKSPVEAALAYDAAAIEMHGPFAKTNAQMGLVRIVKQSKMLPGTQGHFVNQRVQSENPTKD